jgi:hypothetical protein
METIGREDNNIYPYAPQYYSGFFIARIFFPAFTSGGGFKMVFRNN